MKSRYTLLGVAIISFSVVLVSAFLMLLFGVESDFKIESQLFSSKYISEYSEELKSTPTDLPAEENMAKNPDKEGVLVLNESRKVVKFDTVLTDAQKVSIEKKYSIEFTDDEPVNGVYSVITTEISDIETLKENDSVASVETDIPVTMSADTIDWGVSRIGADQIWETSSGSGVVVAVVDTGIQIDHVDLKSNIVSGYDFVNNRTTAIDDNGHGTHVAGIVAASSNQAGTVGTSHSAKLMPVKVLNASGSGYISDVAKGIYWATDNGAKIINLSLGASVDTDILRNAVNYAANKGILLVAAAGNERGAPCQYPAAYSGVICVVATDSSNRLASFSNVGGELSAPGVSNYSTYLNNSYRYLSGTSMASPHVAGSLAVLKSICSTCSSSELRNTLRETAIDLGVEGQDIIFGYGLVDLVSATSKLNPEVVEVVPVPEEEKVVEKPTVPSKKVFDKQKPIIKEPTKDNAGRFTLTEESDITVKFNLEPVSSNSGLVKIILYLDNEAIYTSTKQSDEFIIKHENITGVQQFIRVLAFFQDGSQSHDQLIIEKAVVSKSKAVDNIIRRGRDILGISSGFTLRTFISY